MIQEEFLFLFHRFFIMISSFFIFISCVTTGEYVLKKENNENLKETVSEKNCEESVSNLFSKASSYFDEKKFDSAEILYENLIKCFPDSEKVPYSYFNLGLISFEKKEYLSAVDSFKKSWYLFDSVADKSDAVLLLLDSYRFLSDWKSIVADSNNFLETLNERDVEESVERELILRRSEAEIELGNIFDGVLYAKNIISIVKKENLKGETLYVPELAYGYYILGRSILKEFDKVVFKNDIDTLTKKCTLLLDAQNYFLMSIRTGIVYWSNASAYSVASLYLSLFDDMDKYPYPKELSPDEQSVYRCELWNKTAVLLRKARKKLELNLAIADKDDNHNDYIDKSMKTLFEINAYYSQKEFECSGEENEKSFH